uniref:Uncharacterized protein n=1 Tax=Aegilops tauschii subsp. strangulata TaxID=200361 RepID=A0A453G897_AEGTS
ADLKQTPVVTGSRSLEVGPAARKAMASKQTAPIMNQGQGETSYANNSSIQNAEQNKMKSLIEGVIVELCSNTDTLEPRKIVIADLGCSTGPQMRLHWYRLLSRRSTLTVFSSSNHHQKCLCSSTIFLRTTSTPW